jgi:hypothetical protein
MTRFIAMMFPWGPLLDDELARISYTEAKATGSAGGDAQARFSFRAMARLFSLHMPAETTLATTPQRSRGEVQPYELSFGDPSFGRLYDFIYPKNTAVDMEHRSRLVTAMREGRWPEALKLAYGSGADYATTKTYLTLRNDFIQICSGIGVFLHAPAGFRLASLTLENQQAISHGDYSELHVIAAEAGMSIGWVLAAYVALFRRSASEEVRGAYLAQKLDPLHELLWSVLPAWQSSHEFAHLYLPLLRGEKQGEAHRGRKATPRPATEAPAATAPLESAPTATNSAGRNAAPFGKKREVL